MVKKIVIELFYLLLFLSALLYFLPKEHLYYLVQQTLQEQKITLTQKQLHETPFGIELHAVTLSYEGVPVAKIKDIRVTLFGLYDSVKAEGVELSSLASSYIPPKLSFVMANYSVLHPLAIDTVAQGVFGSLKAVLHLQEKKVLATVKPSHIFQTNYGRSLRYLHRKKDGEYSYAKNF